MIKIVILTLIMFLPTIETFAQHTNNSFPDQTVFVWGHDINMKFTQYIIDLVDKPNPQICYIPTASADNKENIDYWKFICEKLSIEPHVLKVWVSSATDTIPFEKIILGMDAIVVGGGNTLNMMGIWKAQGVDKILKKALQQGTILAGGSAGSICWFQNGVSDSRPAELSLVDGLGLLPYSNCPHYGDSLRAHFFQNKILRREIKAGYASDDFSGILFKNGKFIESVTINELNNSYYISEKMGKIEVEKLKSKYLIKKDALASTTCDTRVINLNLTNELISSPSDPIIIAFSEFITKITKKDINKTFNDTKILKVINYKDSLATVINDRGLGFYCISLFYKNNEIWTNIGEDMGNTPMEAEIAFRERAIMHLAKQQVKD